VAGRAKYGKTLIFADRWFQCDYLREALLRRGVRADVVYSHADARLASADARNKRTKDENARVLERFRDDELDVLINVRMLTEGTDVPSVKTAFLTRQTTSSILLTQMIGRALRGPAFGGTSDAYIVSFIDSWNRVISFADYQTLPEGSADDRPAEYGQRPPLQLISIELVRRLSRTMYEGGTSRAAFLTLLPIGWYRVEFETRPSNGDDVVWNRQLIMVFESEKERYEACMRELAASDWMRFSEETLTLADCTMPITKLRDRYFSSAAEHPGTDTVLDLFQIARHIGQHEGELPSFFEFAERTEHDVDLIARKLLAADPKLSEIEEYTRVEYCRTDRFWQALYPNYDLFYTQVLAAIRRLGDFGIYGNAAPAEGVVTTSRRPPVSEPSDAVKAAVIRRDGNRCCCCGATERLEVDHIVAKYLGGSHRIGQLQTLCRTCNQNKLVAEMNFRTSECLLKRAPELQPESLPLDRQITRDSWLADVRRCVNFYHHCNAVDMLTMDPREPKMEIRLWPGIDARWIDPHLQEIRNAINAQRRSEGFGEIPSLYVTST
jgi:hypothetical protein